MPDRRPVDKSSTWNMIEPSREFSICAARLTIPPHPNIYPQILQNAGRKRSASQEQCGGSVQTGASRSKTAAGISQKRSHGGVTLCGKDQSAIGWNSFLRCIYVGKIWRAKDFLKMLPRIARRE
jgi:hypothetical protein